MLKKFTITIITIFILINGAYGENETIIIEADSLEGIKERGYRAEGNVVLSKDIYTVTSDNVVYDEDKKQIFLKSRAKLTDVNNNNIFAEEAVISNNLLTGEFKNAGIILNNGISIVAPVIRKIDNNNYSMFNSDYYFCPNESLNIDLSYDEIIKQIKKDKLQIFSIHSKESSIDKKQNKIRLKHVFVKFLDVPFFYLPYITSSKPFNSRVSGLSSPSFHSNSNYGASISLPFRFYFFNNVDIEFEPTFYTKKNILFDTTFRYINSNKFFLDLNLKYAHDAGQSKDFKNDFNVSEKNEGKYKNNRFYVDGYSRGILGENTYYFTNLLFASDRYFLRDYFNNYDDILKSKLSIFKTWSDYSYINFETIAFQEIREKKFENILNTPYAVPNIYYFNQKNLFSQNNFLINLNNNYALSHIFNEKKNGYTNFSYYPDMKFTAILDSIYFESNLHLYMDAFKLYSYKNIENKNYDKYRIIPEFDFSMEIPLYFLDFIFIKPKIQYIVGREKNIVNFDFDSIDSELTINNLFSNNRYNGYDIVEGGNRINYGIDGEIYTKYGEIGFNVGQGYRDKVNKKYTIVNFENSVSDILSGFNYQYKNIYLNYLLNVDNKNFNLNRQEIMLEGEFDRFSFDGTYVKIKNNDNNIILENYNEEQLNFYIKYRINENFSLDFEMNNNLKYKKITLLQNSLIYEDGCFKIQLSVRKDSYVDSKEGDNISFGFNFRLKGGLL